MAMETWHYALGDFEAVGESCIFVDYMYCLDHQRFTEDDEAKLDAIHQSLPGDYDINSGTWFQGHLVWGCEPPGLQVTGTLPMKSWSDWHERFVAAVEASSLPRRMESRSDM